MFTLQVGFVADNSIRDNEGTCNEWDDEDSFPGDHGEQNVLVDGITSIDEFHPDLNDVDDYDITGVGDHDDPATPYNNNSEGNAISFG